METNRQQRQLLKEPPLKNQGIIQYILLCHTLLTTLFSSRPGATGHDRIYPIESLSPYQNKWTIKARVTSKSGIKTWQNQKGEGRLFTVNLLDESGEIRATGFNDQVDSLYELFQEGQVYYISKCRVLMAKRQFSNINNDYELTFERDTEVERVIPISYQFQFNISNYTNYY